MKKIPTKEDILKELLSELDILSFWEITAFLGMALILIYLSPGDYLYKGGLALILIGVSGSVYRYIGNGTLGRFVLSIFVGGIASFIAFLWVLHETDIKSFEIVILLLVLTGALLLVALLLPELVDIFEPTKLVKGNRGRR